jgi:hypothetical protein
MKIVDDRSVENMQVVGAGQWTQTLAFGSDPDGRVTNCRERSGIS